MEISYPRHLQFVSRVSNLIQTKVEKARQELSLDQSGNPGTTFSVFVKVPAWVWLVTNARYPKFHLKVHLGG